MSRTLHIFWWLGFIACAVVIQANVPYLDALAAGIVLLLQEKDYKNIYWLLPLFILVQEGIGTRPFGAVLLWYMSILLFFRLCRWLFDVRSALFIVVLAIFLGIAYFAIGWLMTPLQNLAFDMKTTLNNSLLQTIFLPCACFVLWQCHPDTSHVLEN